MRPKPLFPKRCTSPIVACAGRIPFQKLNWPRLQAEAHLFLVLGEWRTPGKQSQARGTTQILLPRQNLYPAETATCDCLLGWFYTEYFQGAGPASQTRGGN